ncbi:hypothetical protein RHO14_07715 [Orbus wheelerorum]|uniref:hypothetical protein n=1 Tax=Orbus wheelerorum TaxID=3074111 RepID=UPI00370DA984
MAGSKNAVENNWGASMFGLSTALKGYYTSEKISDEDKKNAAEGGVILAGVTAGVAAGVVASPLLPESAIIGGAISGRMNAITTGDVNATDVGIWTVVGVITGGYGTVGWGVAGAATSSYLKDEDPVVGGVIAGTSSLIGYGAGKYAQGFFQNKLNPVANKYLYEASNGFTGFTGNYIESSIPAYAGGYLVLAQVKVLII